MEKTVKIEDYNPDWVNEFQQEKARIMGVLKNSCLCVEHIGSTSVIGLGAKPILDIMVGVRHLDVADTFIEPLKSIGNEFVPHQEFPERRFFRKGQWRAGTHHIYRFGSEQWKNQLSFRDYLRNHPDVRKQYQELKLSLAQKHPGDIVAYTKAKAPFIQNVIESAR
ncbi:GrpB family protein [Peribacillus frigoritolerans]|uniref:GrpB family protein n=1 Tax=Peribacillus frigoritolerans TaxID=450367 RepID=UPI0021A97E48|nr:GrpB family protein [Peribacillus frigoritolerans]MCT4475779.1 GrpB family protein [Peribacillus frigoritolerans]